MKFNDLDEKQKKHFLAALFHMKAADAKESSVSDLVDPEKQKQKKYHLRMANMHSNYGGLDLGDLYHAYRNPSSREESDYYAGPQHTDEELNQKNHENDAILPFDADRMMDGLKHHIVQREIARSIGDSNLKRYHHQMVKWHSHMMNEGQQKSDFQPDWTPEEIADVHAKLAQADRLSGDETKYQKDPVHFGTEVFPDYKHKSAAELRHSSVRPKDLEEFFQQETDPTSYRTDELAKHPFSPLDAKVKKILRSSWGNRPELFPSEAMRAIRKIESEARENNNSEDQTSEDIGKIIDNSGIDNNIHDYLLNSKDPELRIRGINRLDKKSPQYLEILDNELRKMQDGDHSHVLDKIVHHLPSDLIPETLQQIKDNHGRGERLKSAVYNTILNLDNHSAASPETLKKIVDFAAKNNPDQLKMLRWNLGKFIKHLSPDALDLDSLARLHPETHKSVLQNKDVPSWLVDKEIERRGPRPELLQHPNISRAKLDQIRNDPTGTHYVRRFDLAKSLMRRPDHSREDFEFSHPLFKDNAQSGSRDQRNERLNLIRNSPHWNHDELSEEAERLLRGESSLMDIASIVNHPNASPHLIDDIVNDERTSHRAFSGIEKTSPNIAPGTAVNLIRKKYKEGDLGYNPEALSDPRLPVNEAIQMYETNPNRFYRGIVNHPMLPDDKLSEIIEKHGGVSKFGKPKELPASVLQKAQIAPPASVPNVRKDRLSYGLSHKKNSLAIESVAKEFATNPVLSWSAVKRKFPHLEKNPEIKKIFEGASDLTKDQFMERLSKLPDQKFHVSYRKWNGAQMHNAAPQLVVQLNAGTDFRKKLAAKPGLVDAFDTIRDKLFSSYHPVLPHSLGWARVDTSHPEHWFVDEIQSDIDADLKKHWDENIKKLGVKAHHISDSIEGWNEHLLQHIINTARAHGVKRLSIHSKSTKMKANHGEDKPSSKYSKIYDEATKKAGFSKVKASDVGMSDRSIHLRPDSMIHTLDLTTHDPIASNAPKEMGKEIKRKRKSDVPKLFSSEKVQAPEQNKLRVDYE